MKRLSSRWVATVTLLAVGVGGQALLAYQLRRMDEGRPDRLLLPLSEFPRQLGEWVGHDEPARADVLAMLKLDDHLQRVYRHPSGQTAILWMGQSATSRDTYHYPTVCMQGAGWSEEESERARLGEPSTAGADVPMLRFRFSKEPRDRQYVYYWYYLIGESSLDQAMRRMSQSARLFLRGRTNASMTVEIFGPAVGEDASLLDDLARRVSHQLERFLPESTRAECELGANL